MATTDEPAGKPDLPRFGIAWSDQSVRLLVLALGVLAVLWLARGIIGPFVVAAVLAYAFSPLVSAVEDRTGWPRLAIVGVGYAVTLGLLALLAVFIARRAGSEIQYLTSGGPDILAT